MLSLRRPGVRRRSIEWSLPRSHATGPHLFLAPRGGGRKARTKEMHRPPMMDLQGREEKRSNVRSVPPEITAEIRQPKNRLRFAMNEDLIQASPRPPVLPLDRVAHELKVSVHANLARYLSIINACSSSFRQRARLTPTAPCCSSNPNFSGGSISCPFACV